MCNAMDLLIYDMIRIGTAANAECSGAKGRSSKEHHSAEGRRNRVVSHCHGSALARKAMIAKGMAKRSAEMQRISQTGTESAGTASQWWSTERIGHDQNSGAKELKS